MAYWMMRSEPDSYSWEDLLRDGETEWDGVRNYAARLHLRAMKPGDQGFFYHSNQMKAVVGIMEIVSDPHPDPKDADWVAVRVKPVRPVDPPVTLAAIKAGAEARRHGDAAPEPAERRPGARRGMESGARAQPLSVYAASLTRLARLRSCGSRWRLRSRIDLGVTSTSSSSSI